MHLPPDSRFFDRYKPVLHFHTIEPCFFADFSLIAQIELAAQGIAGLFVELYQGGGIIPFILIGGEYRQYFSLLLIIGYIIHIGVVQIRLVGVFESFPVFIIYFNA